MSERSEFSGPPADNVRSEGTPKGRRGGRASLLTFLSRDKKVSSPPGRNPGRSRRERSPRQTNFARSQKIEQSVVSRSTLSSYAAQSQTHRIRISSSDASTARTLLCTIRNTVLGVPFPCEPPSVER